MVIVSTKNELKQAIERGEKKVWVADEKFLKQCKAAEYLQDLDIDFINPVRPGKVLNLLSETTIILLGIAAIIGAIAIVAIIKNQRVRIKVNKSTGEIEVETYHKE